MVDKTGRSSEGSGMIVDAEHSNAPEARTFVGEGLGGIFGTDLPPCFNAIVLMNYSDNPFCLWDGHNLLQVVVNVMIVCHRLDLDGSMDCLAFAAWTMISCRSALSKRTQLTKSSAQALKAFLSFRSGGCMFLGSIIRECLREPPPPRSLASRTVIRATAVCSAPSRMRICWASS